jgi:hypothetical protein
VPPTAQTHPTLLDVTSRLDPNDKVSVIAELLTQRNEVLEDMVWIEGNLLTGHTTTVRTGIPMPTWRKLYGGVQPTKSTTARITDTCGMLENYGEVDKALADLNGNTAAFRLSENRPVLEGFNQEVAGSLFYANEETEPEAFTGLAPRFSSLAAPNGRNIVDAAGNTATMTSVYLIVWGPDTVHGIYPKGSKVGFQMADKGQVTIENADGNGGRMEAYRTHYRWDLGLTVRDWRYIVRIANIDLAALKKDPAAGGADLVDLLTIALERVEDLGSGRPAFYVSRTIREYLRRQMVTAVKSSTLQMSEIAGKQVLSFDGVPVRRTDQLLGNEARIT